MARCNLQFGSFLLGAASKGAQPLTLQAVQVTETDSPEDEDPVKWTLLTSLPVDSAEAAREVIGFYFNRWKIEDNFRILKSGCRVEYLAFRTADRLTCAIAINAAIAWRIHLMTPLGREAPHHDPQLMFTDEEITLLRDHARAYAQLPPENHGAVHLVAMLGGYQARKHDPEPGAQIMWREQERLSAATIAYEVKAVVDAQEALFRANDGERAEQGRSSSLRAAKRLPAAEGVGRSPETGDHTVLESPRGCSGSAGIDAIQPPAHGEERRHRRDIPPVCEIR